jgi:DNA modification methylase
MAKPSSLLDTRVIYCGDNLEQLKKLPDACVDLIYIDPPFNSNRNYEVFWGETKEKRSFDDRHESTRAYIEFMRPRCVELARVLKKTGSFYYHCDWHASHYVKVLLDQVFGENNFQNEIVWKRTSSHNASTKYGVVHDTLFFYTGGDAWTWNPQFQPFDEYYLSQFYTHYDADKRRWRRSDLTGDGLRNGDSGKPWRGVDVTAKGRHWAVPTGLPCLGGLESASVQDRLDALDQAGLIHWPKKEDGVPMYKRYADQQSGVPLQSVWDDIPPLHNLAAERLGYPTQKPVALLDRIIKASSNENDIVLDAFCGCGTALVAAQNLNRQWIGIDVSPTACRVMAKRLRDVCRIREDENLWLRGKGFVVRDLPWTEKQLRTIPPFEFENWAVIALGGIPNKTQVGDMGIDGRIYPVGSEPSAKKDEQLDFMDDWYPVQVKQMDKVGRPDIDKFEAAMMRAKRKKGFFVGFDFSSDSMLEIGRFFQREHISIIPLTVREILDETIAARLA